MINFSFITKILSLGAFKKLLVDRVLSSFKEAFKDTNKSFGFTTEANPAVIDYLKQREIILSEKTMSRLHGNLQFELLEGINNKESIREIVNRINPLFDNMKDYELERIARTEVINAQNAGEFHSHVQSGIATHKQWVAHKDSRTGSDSLRLDGQIVPINDEFVDYKTGNTCMHSPMRPNDRCTCIYLYKLPETIKKHGLIYKK